MPKVKDKGVKVPNDHPYGGMTIKELREQLKKRGAEDSGPGRKAELVARLESCDNNCTQETQLTDIITDTKILNMTEARTDTHTAKPWDDNHKDGQKMVSEDTALVNLLFHSMSILGSEMILSDEFWDLLLRKGVIDEKLNSSIQTYTSQQFQVYDLVGHLMRGKVHQVHALFWVLVNTKQHKLVEMLGFPAKAYFDVPHMLKSGAINCPSCSEVFSTNAYILVQCGHYVCRPCIKGAHFTVEDDKTEVITCPVSGCGKTTRTLPSKDDEIGLERDGVFMSMVRDLMDCSKEKICHLCSYELNLSYRKHFCTGCKKFLCGACINKHEGEGHYIIHQHSADVCCHHGKKTETFCVVCNIFRCESKEEKQCDHHIASKEPENNNTSTQYMVEQVQEIGAKAEDYEKLDKVLENRKTEIQDYVQHHRDEVKRVMDEWYDDKVSYISRMTRQVKVKHKQSLHWKALSSELIDIQADQPWMDLPLDKLDLTLPFEAEAFAAKIRDGEPPSKIVCGVPYVPAPASAPTIAKYKAEWHIIECTEFWPSVAWTSSGQLLVTTPGGLQQVNYNEATSSCTASTIYEATHPTQISTAEDGSLVMTLAYAGLLIVNDVKRGEIVEWRPPDIRAYSAAIDNSCIYVRESVSPKAPTVHIYTRHLLKQSQHNFDYEWESEDSLLHLSQTGEILIGLCSNDGVLVMNPQTGIFRVFETKGTENKLDHPAGVCTVSGGDYILVAEYINDCVSVFTYKGEHLHDLHIDGGAGSPYSVSILERQGEPPLMALAMMKNYQWYVKLYTLS